MNGKKPIDAVVLMETEIKQAQTRADAQFDEFIQCITGNFLMVLAFASIFVVGMCAFALFAAAVVMVFDHPASASTALMTVLASVF